ncbi:MAG: cell division protein FtsA [Dehalococcoidia bacterium]|nr:cell division protein FtsA [Dehalococcoidia bacterium]
MRDNLYVALDVGTSKVATLVGQVHLDGRVEVVGAGVVESAGLAKGAVISIPEAQEAIRASLEEAAVSSGRPIHDVYATVTGTHLQFSTRQGSIHSPHYSVPISYPEVDRAIETAYPTDISPELQVLHLVPRSYTVDGLKGVRNPIGMHALRLDVECLCISAASAPIRNLLKAIEHSRVKVAGLIMSGLASGETVLTRDEREMGVLLVEIGGGVTTVAVFQQDSLAGASVLPVGGVNCTSDLAMALNTPLEVAERIKLQHGNLMPDNAASERVEIPSFGEGAALKVDQREVARYLRDRMEEVLRMAALQARSMGYATLPPAGIVLTGGSANLPGLSMLARRTLSVPARIGSPRGIAGLQEQYTNPSYAAVLGTLQWAARNRTAHLHKVGHALWHHGGNGTNGTPNGNGHGVPSGRELPAKAMAWLRERAKRVAL